MVRFVGILELDGDLDLGPVTGTYYMPIPKKISNIPTVNPTLLTQTRRITRHNVSVTRYKSVIKNMSVKLAASCQLPFTHSIGNWQMAANFTL